MALLSKRHVGYVDDAQRKKFDRGSLATILGALRPELFILSFFRNRRRSHVFSRLYSYLRQHIAYLLADQLRPYPGSRCKHGHLPLASSVDADSLTLHEHSWTGRSSDNLAHRADSIAAGRSVHTWIVSFRETMGDCVAQHRKIDCVRDPGPAQ
jgi:hypothetical protein